MKIDILLVLPIPLRSSNSFKGIKNCYNLFSISSWSSISSSNNSFQKLHFFFIERVIKLDFDYSAQSGMEQRVSLSKLRWSCPSNWSSGSFPAGISRQSLGDASTGWSGVDQGDGAAVDPATGCAEDPQLVADRRTTPSTLDLWSKDESLEDWPWSLSGRPEAAEETRCVRSRTSYPRCWYSLHPRFHSPLLFCLRPESCHAPGSRRRSLFWYLREISS